ncbi:MAG: DUF362 domain-containing protein [Candidatus Aenigmatarchaeota archaeon]
MESKVAIVKTNAKDVLGDYATAMRIAELKKSLKKENKTILKLNLSWTKFFPACSTPPWQLDAVLKFLREENYKEIIAVENQTVVTHPWKGAYFNKWLPILRKYGIEFVPLTNVEWVYYQPKTEMLAMYEIFKEILIPKIFFGTNILHLPTMKTHGHTITTGAIKNAFGGLIPKYRHHAHKRIHEVLVDLLAIQKEIHEGIFAVMDGCICGDGAGPRTMVPKVGNLILASDDQVAIDAVAAKIMGFEPMKIDYIRLAHERGLGCGDLDQIEILGMEKSEFKKLNFGFKVKKSPIIAWDQRLRKGTEKIKWLHRLLFYSPIFKIFIFASEFYHDKIWYPTVGRKRIKEFLKSDWGNIFLSYEYGEFPKYLEVKEWDPY